MFVDGHEDTMPLDVSEDGEAANTEIGLLLGLTGRLMTGPLAGAPALAPDRLAMLGQRDDDWRRRFNVGSLRDHGRVAPRRSTRSQTDPAGIARAAVQHDVGGDGWWLHIDLDVLDPVEFPAQGQPRADDPGGLTWAQLTELLSARNRRGGCSVSVAIYDPDQDPDRGGARYVVELLRAVAPKLG